MFWRVKIRRGEMFGGLRRLRCFGGLRWGEMFGGFGGLVWGVSWGLCLEVKKVRWLRCFCLCCERNPEKT